MDDATGTVQWNVTGVSPNRVFTVQFADYLDYWSGSGRLNFQVRLFETTNQVQFAYGSKVAPFSASSSASIGIKGKLTTSADYIEGTTGSRTTALSNLTSTTGFPAANTLFSFSPDTNAPIGLTGVAGNARVDLKWNRTRRTNFQRYNIYMGTSASTLTLRDQTLSQTDTTISITALTNGTTYYFAVTSVGTDGTESGIYQIIAVTPTSPPIVAIASPASGAVFNAGTSVPISATASDPDGTIARVEYYSSSTLIGTSFTGPTYAMTWFSPPPGSLTITARAFDNLGSSTISSPITVIVNSLPAVSWVGPLNGSLFSIGANIPLSASASDADDGVAKVEFYNGAVKLGEALNAPYAFTWSAVPRGRYVLTARATDTRGALTTSASIIVMVTQKPSVSIISPASGAVVSTIAGALSLSATASDPDGSIANVYFYSGTILIGTGTNAGAGSYIFSWFTAAVGAQSVKAVAVDDLGATDTSLAVNFTINAIPTVSLTAPPNGTRYLPGADIPMTANASDINGGTISRVEFYQGATKLGEDLTAPYGFTWSVVTTGVYSLTARAIDNDGGVGISSARSVIVTSPPTVSITSPVDGSAASYPGIIPLTATASDADGTVGRVDFYSNGTLLGSTTVGNPYVLNWTPTFSGIRDVVARVFDNYNVEGKADTIHITLSTGPVVSLTSPVHFAAYPTLASIGMAATASDPVSGISEVRFYRDSVLLGTDASSPYSITWNNAPSGRYRIQARAVNNAGITGYSQAVTVFVNDSTKSKSGGRVLVTGHDADDHNNVDFISAGLDYLLFGQAARPFEVPFRKGARIAFLGDNKGYIQPILDYSPATFINVSLAGWETLAFDATHYDALIVGTGGDFVSSSASAALNAQRAKFDQYFNQGGGIFAMSEQGLGQTFYNFLPAFGSAQHQTIPSVSGQFTVTSAGLSIGLTESIVDRDLTHTEFYNVDTLFRTFETYNQTGNPVTIGANAIIEDGGFVPSDPIVENPVAIARDSVFSDTLCVRFSTPTSGASIHLTTNGGIPDTSSWVIANGDMVCIDKSTTFLAIGKQAGWISSGVESFSYRKLGQVDAPLPNIASPYFRDSLCVRFTSATSGAEIHYTLDGGNPDTSSLVKPNGDPVCFYDSQTIRVIGKKAGMEKSDTASYRYLEMLKLPIPQLDVADLTYFTESICVTLIHPTLGAHIHYTLDGSKPDSSETHGHNGDKVCLDSSTTIRAVAEKLNWIPSDENQIRVVKMDTVARPVADIADSTYFRDNQCITLTSATPGALIHYTLDGGNPDTSSMFKANGDSVCIDRSLQLKAVAKKTNWVTSPSVLYHYLRMEKLSSALPDIPGGTLFNDSLCIRFSTNTGGASLWFTLDGTDPLLSSSTLPIGAALCLDSSTTIRAVVKKTNWINSDEASFTYLVRLQVAKPTASRLDSTYFRDSICVRFSTTTDSALIHYVLNGGRPDTSALTLANHQDICFEKSARIDAVAMRPDWVTSRATVLHFLKMDTAAVVSATPGDSTYFRTSQCITLASATPGAEIHYTLDGRNPDSTGMVKATGDTVCIEDTITIRALARKTNWVQSPERTYRFIRMQQVAKPNSDPSDSTWFVDSVCVRLTDVTPGAQIRYSTDGGKPDTSALILESGQSLCRDRTTEIRVVATKPDWIPSDEIKLHLIKMDTVSIPIADKADSTYFRDSLCVNISAATAGSEIHYTLNGFASDTAKAFLAGSGRLCFEDTVTVRAMGQKHHWVNSPEISRTYIRMQKVAKPDSDQPDSTWFTDSACVRLTDVTPGAQIRYSTDGGKPDTSALILESGQSLCRDRTTEIRVVATKPDWIPSDEIKLHLIKMDTVSIPIADKADSTYFRDSLCVNISAATAGSEIHYTLNGFASDTAKAFLAGSGRLCFEDTVTVRAMGQKHHWVNSPEISRTYIRMQKADKPMADKPDSLYFTDSTCVKFTSATAGVRIRYTLHGGLADSSSRSIGNGESICLDSSAILIAVAEKTNWINSDATMFHVFRMETVQPPHSDKPDSTYFKDSLCVLWTIPTPDADIHLTTDGGAADTAKSFGKTGSSVCMDRSTTFNAVGKKSNWKNSAQVARNFFRMQPAVKPAFDRGDTVFYPTTCVKLFSGTEGADLHYTLDGGNPDTSSLVKHGGDTLCVDRTLDIKVIAKKKNWLDSEPAGLHLEKMQQVAAIHSSMGDSAVFAGKLCLILTSETDSVRIAYSLDGGDPLASGLTVRSGEKLCLEHSAEIVAVGTRPLWRNSLPARFVYEVDNQGPDILKAEKRPYNIVNLSVSGTCRGIGQDTLVLTLTEKLTASSHPPRWERLAVFSPRCDLNATLPVPIHGMPSISSDSLTYTILLDNTSSDDVPMLGNCIYLEPKSSEFVDRVGNRPDVKGTRLEGREKVVHISQLRAYPPVVGLGNATAAQGCMDEGVVDNSWIPPFGFDPVRGSVDEKMTRNCNGGESVVESQRTEIPSCTSIMEVISDGAYVAEISIFDQLGNFVIKSRQQFGACGELDDRNRSVAGKKRSYLVWNTRDSREQRVGNGVYVWRINFSSVGAAGSSSQKVVVRTGFMRSAACNE